jgi:hypothetical protein
MTTFPKISYVCPIPWSEMHGDESERFCSKCSRTVVNVSLLTEAQRVALLQSVPPEQLCIAYYRRLSGEFVSAENPLSGSEARRIVQYGVAALSLGALAAAAHYVEKLPPNPSLIHTKQRIEVACDTAMIAAGDLTETVIKKVAAPFLPKRPEPVELIMGMMVCPPPPPLRPEIASPPPELQPEIDPPSATELPPLPSVSSS